MAVVPYARCRFCRHYMHAEQRMRLGQIKIAHTVWTFILPWFIDDNIGLSFPFHVPANEYLSVQLATSDLPQV